VLYNCLSWCKFVYTHLYYSRQLYNIDLHIYHTYVCSRQGLRLFVVNFSETFLSAGQLFQSQVVSQLQVWTAACQRLDVIVVVYDVIFRLQHVT